MSDVFAAVGDAIGGFVDSPFVQLGMRAVAVYIVALWLAAAFVVWRDLGRRYTWPVAPYVGASAMILSTPLLFPATWIVIRMIRPDRTIDDRIADELDLELLREQGPQLCDGCGHGIERGWLVCPSCGTRVGRRCVGCGSVLELAWDLCPWCAQDMHPGIATDARPRPRPVPAAEPLPLAAARRHDPATS